MLLERKTAVIYGGRGRSAVRAYGISRETLYQYLRAAE